MLAALRICPAGALCRLSSQPLPVPVPRPLQDWRWQQRGKRQKGERPPIAAPSYGEPSGRCSSAAHLALQRAAQTMPQCRWLPGCAVLTNPTCPKHTRLQGTRTLCRTTGKHPQCDLEFAMKTIRTNENSIGAGRKDIVKDKRKTAFVRNVPFRWGAGQPGSCRRTLSAHC